MEIKAKTIETKKDYGASIDELIKLVEDIKSDRNYPMWRLFKEIMYEGNHDKHYWIFRELENAAINKLKEILDDIVVSDEDGKYSLLEYSDSTFDDEIIPMNEEAYRMSLN